MWGKSFKIFQERMWILSEKYKSPWLVSWYLLHRIGLKLCRNKYGTEESVEWCENVWVFFLFGNFQYFSYSFSLKLLALSNIFLPGISKIFHVFNQKVTITANYFSRPGEFHKWQELCLPSIFAIWSGLTSQSNHQRFCNSFYKWVDLYKIRCQSLDGENSTIQ